MGSIFVSFIAFMLLGAADFALLGAKPRAASRLRRIGYAGVGAALAHLMLSPRPGWPFPESLEFALPSPPFPSAPPPPVFALPLAALVLVFIAFLIRTVFLEFGAERRRLGLGPDALVATGSYGLCRHPGFWWLLLLTAALAGMRGIGSWAVPVAALSAFNFALIYIQDRVVFPKIFEGYDDYKKGVPFLIPRRVKGRGTGEKHRSQHARSNAGRKE